MTTTRQIKIEKGIPMPNALSSASSEFSRLEIGDSFSVQNISSNKRNYIQRVAARGGFKLLSRKEEGGYRFWRVA